MCKTLGLESHKPTDCVGTVSEARLAFAMRRARGVHGAIADDVDVDDFLAEANTTLDRYTPAGDAGLPTPSASPHPWMRRSRPTPT